jgi:hypothetical protein
MQGALVTKFREVISARFRGAPNSWITLDEFPLDSGGNGKGRIDLIAISCDRHRPIKRVAFEIKIDRGDFIQEGRHPEKLKRAHAVCDYYYFVVPKGLVQAHEVPSKCGLIEISQDLSIDGISKRAPKLAGSEPSLAFMRDVARRKYQIERRDGAVIPVFGVGLRQKAPRYSYTRARRPLP